MEATFITNKGGKQVTKEQTEQKSEEIDEMFEDVD